MSEHVREASELTELTEQVSGAAEEGSRAVATTIDGIGDIRTLTLDTKSVRERLAERISQIGEIVDVIGSINDETNLFSLNAAIIAAQVGKAQQAPGSAGRDACDASAGTFFLSAFHRGSWADASQPSRWLFWLELPSLGVSPPPDPGNQGAARRGRAPSACCPGARGPCRSSAPVGRGRIAHPALAGRAARVHGMRAPLAAPLLAECGSFRAAAPTRVGWRLALPLAPPPPPGGPNTNIVIFRGLPRDSS